MMPPWSPLVLCAESLKINFIWWTKTYLQKRTRFFVSKRSLQIYAEVIHLSVVWRSLKQAVRNCPLSPGFVMISRFMQREENRKSCVWEFQENNIRTLWHAKIRKRTPENNRKELWEVGETAENRWKGWIVRFKNRSLAMLKGEQPWDLACL